MLAIVIPYFKINFFEATLQSLSNQSDKRFKVYIGDDASDENPKEIIKKFESDFEINYHKFETNFGSKNLSSQWQRCVGLTSNEEWIMLLCDDDVLSENCISEFYKNLEEVVINNINVIRFATDIIDDKGFVFNKIVFHPKIENAVDFFIRRQNGGTRNSLSENIFKKDIVEKIKFKKFPLAWHSDDLALLEFSNFGDIYTINNAIVYFRLSEINITNKKDNVLIKSKASFKFFLFLLNVYKTKFSFQQRELIKKKLEKNMLQNKKDISRWFLIFSLYFRNLYIKDFFNLLFKIPKSIIK
jgi:glycosyltransferase involved in cell wall biosynthesis